MTWTRRAARGGIAMVAAVLALSCGGGGDDGPAGNTGSIQVTVDPAALSVAQGGSISAGVALTRSGGFSGAVTLAITGLPAGVTTTITPAQLSGATATATVNMTVAPTVAIGIHTATVTATAQGVAAATTTYQLTVTALPDFALTVAPPAVALTAGTSGGATVTINRTNFTGGVAFALLNPPAGITGAFTPSPSTTGMSALVVSVAANVAPGSYPLTIRGTAAGLPNRDASLQLTVTPVGGSSVEYEYCNAGDVPIFFAYQDGAGAWQPVTGTTSGGTTTFAFTITQGRGGVLAVWRYSSSIVADALSVGRVGQVRRIASRRSGLRDRTPARVARGSTRTLGRSTFVDVYETGLLFASATELAQDGADACQQAQPTKTITGTVVGVGSGQYGIMSLGGASLVFNGATATNPVTFTDVPGGTVDFIGSRLVTPGMPPDKIVLFRGLNIPDGGSLPSTIDFNGTASSAPATATATITGGGGDNLEIFTELLTANSQMLMWFDLAPSPTSTRPWAGLSASAMVGGDYHGLVVFASPPGVSGDNFRVSLKYVGPVANETLAFGPVINPATATQVAAGAYPRYRFQGAVPAEYDKGVTIDVLSGEDEGNVMWILASGAYLTASGNALAYDITMPDVSGLTGFPAAARLSGGVNAMATSAFGFTGAGIFDVVPSVGSAFRSSVRSSQINVP